CSSPPRRWSPKSPRRSRCLRCRTTTTWSAWTTSRKTFRTNPKPAPSGAGFSISLLCLDEIEPPLDAIETAVDAVDAARDAGVLRLEEPEAFLYLGHGCLQI